MFKTLETPSEFGLRCNASVSHKRKYFFVQILNVLFYSVNIHLLLKLVLKLWFMTLEAFWLQLVEIWDFFWDFLVYQCCLDLLNSLRNLEITK